MTYRESAAPDPIRFTDSQLAWIAATTTEQVVRANLAGKNADAVAPRVTDNVGQALLWTGLAFTGVGGMAAFVTASMLSAIAIVPGILVAGAAVHRLRAGPNEAPSFAITTVAPKFERHVRTNADGAEKTFTFLVTEQNGAVYWPPELQPLAAGLADHARLRVGIARRGRARYVSWAFPI